MYHKALLMHDTATAARILAAPTPAAAKALGREVKNFRQEVWDQACDEVVGEGQYLKFSQNTGLGEVLLGTGKRELVEASPNDRVWGVGFNSEEAEGREGEWGENRLGRALMAARGRLRGERG
ncbi:DUF1768-domain-containing protein [Lophium mytilinum]|uniref:DUF1768-domain-containing protein n=1 Tax=Lophium mytilinum TaxID=390894 RepID=A0A6A6R1V1_9PEZI|nr:DUF1768-domain-containing protein [Lophium mytilinum]